jgi:hypothetical protein
MSTATVEIHPLSPERLADFMAFFEGEAFSDNPKWSSCYCQCFYEDHSKIHWASRTAAENRACASNRIVQGQMQGLLAYLGGQVVGWCNAAPRELLMYWTPSRYRIRSRLARSCVLSLHRAFEAKALQQLCSTLHANTSPRRAFDSWRQILAPTQRARPRTTLGFLACTLLGFTVRRTDNDGSVWVGKELQSTP